MHNKIQPHLIHHLLLLLLRLLLLFASQSLKSSRNFLSCKEDLGESKGKTKAPDANREASGMSKNSKRERKKSWKEIDNQIVKWTKGINK
jgi:hypothetical protein